MNRDAHILTMMVGLFHELTKSRTEAVKLQSNLAARDDVNRDLRDWVARLQGQLEQSEEKREAHLKLAQKGAERVKVLEAQLADSEAANQNYREAIDRLGPKLEPMERDAVLVGLRLLQRRRTTLSDELMDILTNGGKHVGLGMEGIDALCERINV